jgi:TM2 domain-containing membrane protein YozV
LQVVEGEKISPFLFIRMGRIYVLVLFIFCASFASGRVNNVPAYKAQSAIAIQYSIQHGCVCIAGADSVVPHRKHKFIAALLAFPLGIFGLHRIYLGTATGVPFLYIATLGGAFGVLPFVDFVLIILCKDINVYAHNPGVFMWGKKKQ